MGALRGSAAEATPVSATVLAAGMALAMVLASASPAVAQPSPPVPAPEPAPAPAPVPVAEPDGAAPAGPKRNIVYRARVDGVVRGASVDWSTDTGPQSATPTMVPGRVFEVYAVLPETEQATLRVAVGWPYSANLHCEILVDDRLVASADDFVGPRLTPQWADPDFGAITCAAPVGGVPDVAAPAPAPPA